MIASFYILKRDTQNLPVHLEELPDCWRGRIIRNGSPWVTGQSQGEVEDRLLEIYGQYDEEEGVWRA